MRTKTYLNKLYKELKTWKAVADEIGISVRHIHYIRETGKVGRFLKQIIADTVRLKGL